VLAATKIIQQTKITTRQGTPPAHHTVGEGLGGLGGIGERRCQLRGCRRMAGCAGYARGTRGARIPIPRVMTFNVDAAAFAATALLAVLSISATRAHAAQGNPAKCWCWRSMPQTLNR